MAFSHNNRNQNRSTLPLYAAHKPTAWFLPLTHPLWWIALGLLLLNDHILKGADVLPGWATGKISDFAGLIVAPVLVAAIFRTRRLAEHALAFALVVIPFALINVWTNAALWVEGITAALGFPWKIWPDPTDLAALAVLPVALHITRTASGNQTSDKNFQRIGHQRVATVGALLGGVACLATSQPHHHDPRMPVRVTNRSDKALEVCVFHLVAPLDCKSLQNDIEKAFTPAQFTPGKCMSTGDYDLRTSWLAPVEGDKSSTKMPDGKETCGAILLKSEGLKTTVVYQKPAPENAPSEDSQAIARVFIDSKGDDIVITVPASLQVWNPPWEVQ